MEMLDGSLHIDAFLAVTLGIVVLFAGKRLNEADIPQPFGNGIRDFPTASTWGYGDG